MAQEDKQLLLKDLSVRLSHGVIVSTPKGDGHLCSINQTIFGNEYGVNIEATKRDYFNDNKCDIKPYLRPMSSMTEKEHIDFFNYHYNIGLEEIKKSGNYLKAAYLSDSAKFDWLNKHHFDYRYLIERGLAIKVTKENNPYEN